MLARSCEERNLTVISSSVCLSHYPHWLWLSFHIYRQAIEFLYNVQHDCPQAKCVASGKQPLMQERTESGILEDYIEHQPIDRFVINTHAFHNAHLLRATLPRSLVAPIPLHHNREAKHHEIAGSLRIMQESKRKATKARSEQKKQALKDNGEMTSGPNKRPRVEYEMGQQGLDQSGI